MRKLLILFSFALLLISCETELVYKPKESAPEFVIYSFLQKDSFLTFHISKTATVNSESATYLAEDGILSLYANDALYTQIPYYATPNWVQVQGVVLDHSTKYKLAFESESVENLFAEAVIPKPISILSVDTTSNIMLEPTLTDSMISCEVIFKDSIGIKNYYQLVVKSHILYKDSANWSYEEVDFLKSDDLFFSSIEVVGGLGSGIDFEGLFTDLSIDGKKYYLSCQVPKNLFFLNDGEMVKRVEFKLYTLSYEYYQYYMSRKYIDGYQGVPYLNPVISYSNVLNGLGCVSGLSLSNYFIEVKK